MAQFDLVENSDAYGWAIPFVEEDDFMLAKVDTFVETGYESNYAFVNMGTNVIILTLLFFFMSLLVCMSSCRKS